LISTRKSKQLAKLDLCLQKTSWLKLISEIPREFAKVSTLAQDTSSRTRSFLVSWHHPDQPAGLLLRGRQNLAYLWMMSSTAPLLASKTTSRRSKRKSVRFLLGLRNWLERKHLGSRSLNTCPHPRSSPIIMTPCKLPRPPRR
jgi:hypothetical protein